MPCALFLKSKIQHQRAVFILLNLESYKRQNSTGHFAYVGCRRIASLFKACCNKYFTVKPHELKQYELQTVVKHMGSMVHAAVSIKVGKT